MEAGVWWLLGVAGHMPASQCQHQQPTGAGGSAPGLQGLPFARVSQRVARLVSGQTLGGSTAAVAIAQLLTRQVVANLTTSHASQASAIPGMTAWLQTPAALSSPQRRARRAASRLCDVVATSLLRQGKRLRALYLLIPGGDNGYGSRYEQAAQALPLLWVYRADTHPPLQAWPEMALAPWPAPAGL